ncbi:MAG TPA: DUF397 domain-containing protein [Trebonia sp.]|nr:DUF397 domain-containing protein [Trebonia sp.]
MSTGSEWRKSSYSTDTGGNCVEVGRWRKSSYSTSIGGSCVEVSAPGDILVRDTTDRNGPALAFRGSAWHHFLTSLR